MVTSLKGDRSQEILVLFSYGIQVVLADHYFEITSTYL